MENKIDMLEKLLVGDEGLLISLRFGDGLNKNNLEKVFNILETLAEEWSDEHCIPKKAVDLFVDIYPVMVSACKLYDKKEEMEILNAADKIMDLIRECVRIR
ncbi:hypothetical protein GCM10011571_24330 [Marinithermofilum abyssi]|jgi:hypothetical protein|uniref:Uncharacterized protein n=1 Tax=Marinithermofilum abyssi TaxID=1571185 RepID=A0A8J2VIL6_9BACL|nr:hypothetical protein [Marinithermofilum abyssi]GGE21374.1 hypothetical protein GCM10011571_24330 [Marinithermofilum abyssi]